MFEPIKERKDREKKCVFCGIEINSKNDEVYDVYGSCPDCFHNQIDEN